MREAGREIATSSSRHRRRALRGWGKLLGTATSEGEHPSGKGSRSRGGAADEVFTRSKGSIRKVPDNNNNLGEEGVEEKGYARERQNTGGPRGRGDAKRNKGWWAILLVTVTIDAKNRPGRKGNLEEKKVEGASAAEDDRIERTFRFYTPSTEKGGIGKDDSRN